jgi:hypothetical protein
LDGGDIAAAAFIGECASGCAQPGAKKTQCLHPDKPAMFACGDCPRRGGKAAQGQLDGSEIATAAFIGECSAGSAESGAKKTQCLHPDKPMMFACGDCPRRGGKAATAAQGEIDGTEIAAAAFIGECTQPGAKKTQCLHPDKPAMFACGDCPRRGGKAAIAAQAEFDGSEIATAAFVGESSGQAAKKTQCLHPDKPAMFACGDCPRRGGKAPSAAEAELDGSGIAAAAYVGESQAVDAKKTQCLHPDKPAMFACGDCPRRG